MKGMIGFLISIFSMVNSVCYPYAAIEYDFTLPVGLDGTAIYGPGTPFLKATLTANTAGLYWLGNNPNGGG